MRTRTPRVRAFVRGHREHGRGKGCVARARFGCMGRGGPAHGVVRLLGDYRASMTELEAVRASLVAARAAGASFDASWARVLQDVSREWRHALEETGDQWRAAYERRDDRRRLRALRVLGEDDDREPIEQHTCAYCGNQLAAGRRKYCGPSCVTAARRRGRTVAA